MHLLSYVFSLKKFSFTNRQNIFERLFTELVSAYLSSEVITRRPVKSVLALVHVPGWAPAYYFSLTNSVVTDPLSSPGIYGGVGRFIARKFVRLDLFTFFC
jgi:hypothetical protein